MILAGDVGGTSTRLGLFEPDGSGPLHVEVYPSRAHAGLEEIVLDFAGGEPVDRACFGIAGPVRGGRCIEATNLAWTVDGASLAGALGLREVTLLNDLEANAWGIAALGPDDLVVLQEGDADAEGNAAVVSAGTGLGVAGLYWDGARHHPFATEGGHVDFAPRSELERALHRSLLARYGHVSYERVCSGIGLSNVYRFLTGEELDAAQIARVPDEAASASLDLMVSIYGAFAGSVALALGATGGVYLGGGIAPKILDRLAGGRFLDAFLDKGRFAPLLERIPVRVVTEERTALLGAALRAAAEPAAAGSRR